MQNKNVRWNWRNRTSHLWQSRQSRIVEAEFKIFGSHGEDEMRKWIYPYLEVLAEHVWKMNEIFRVLAERKYGKRNVGSLAVKAEQKCGSATSYLWKSPQRWNAEVDLTILGRPGRTSAEDEQDLSKSWPSGITESETSDLCQSRQSRSAEAELHIFGSPGSDEMRKWTYPYLEFLAEQVRKKNEIFQSLGRGEVRKAELLIFDSKNRTELRKWSFRSLKVLAEQSWCAEAELISLAAKAGRKCRSGTSHVTKNWQSRAEVWDGFHVTSLVVRPNGSAGAEFQNWQSYQVGSVEAELYILGQKSNGPLQYWTNFNH